MKRTDVHSPSNIVPENYEYIATFVFDDFDLSGYLQAEREAFNRHREATGGKFSNHNHKGNCGVCGAHCKHYAIFFHVPTNQYIKTGLDCAEKLSHGLEHLFKRARTELEAAEKSRSGKKLAWVKLTEAGIREKVEAVFDERLKCKFPQAYGAGIAIDIIGKLIQYGSLSDKQFAFLAKLCGDIPRDAEIKQAKADVDAKRPQAPEGRLVIVGTVLSVKQTEDTMFPTWKMTVETPEGWLCYCTIPSSIERLGRGDKVQFTATLSRSEQRHFMAFGSRPSKGAVLETAPQQ